MPSLRRFIFCSAGMPLGCRDNEWFCLAVKGLVSVQGDEDDEEGEGDEYQSAGGNDGGDDDDGDDDEGGEVS